MAKMGRKYRHGHCGTLPYHSWQGMKARCNNPKNNQYTYYGGRGIKVCDRWFNSYENFIQDVGLPPSDKHSIDRIDTNGNYEPGNCRWATDKEQAANRRKMSGYSIRKTAIKLTCFGITKTIKEWLNEAAVGKTAIRTRLALGWLPEDALFKPRNTK